MNKNIPNYLTIFRLFLVIPFVILFIAPIIVSKSTQFPSYSTQDWKFWCIIAAGIIFFIAMFTDYLDGYLARKYQVVSTFGKFFDPIADKFITNSALVIFAVYFAIPIWVVIPILLRDMLVDGIRMMSSQQKIVISASYLGKVKTFIFSFALGIIFFVLPIINDQNIYNNGWELWVLNIPIIICLILSLLSGYQYVMKAKVVLKGSI